MYKNYLRMISLKLS